MEQDSFLFRYEIFSAAAALAAHASNPREGFRQRDLRFLSELFGNWLELSHGEFSSLIQNTQVLRYLDSLAMDGFAKKTGRHRKPLYKLTRVGVLELLSRMRNASYINRHHFLFVFYFFKNYRDRLEALIMAEESKYPMALKLEFSQICDVAGLVESQIIHAKNDYHRLEERISDAEKTSELLRVRLGTGVPMKEIIEEAERRYPYDLNSRKPLSELIYSLPENQREWELSVGNKARAAEIWKPQLAIQKAYLGELEKLRGSLGRSESR